MALKKQMEIKIEGDYVKGKIINNLFATNQLVIVNASMHTSVTIKKVIDELTELYDTLEGLRVADKLSEDSTNELPWS